jgi:signal transduction histidine kinase/HAMP domain-containing protein/CheY-like chemotaxis protein
MESMHHNLHIMLDRGELLKALRLLRRGDFSVRMPLNLTGIDGEIAQAFNDVVELEEAKAAEIARVADLVGKHGQMSHRMSVPGASGSWLEVIDAMNNLIRDLAYPVNEVARVIGSVAKGDLSETMVLEVEGRPLRGEALRLGEVVNTMVGQLNGFAAEVTRVAREVGTEGRLGGQAQVPGVAGVWKDLTDHVNQLAANLTGQVRNIAEVTTAVARGDLSKKVTVDVQGEILELKSTVNTMVDQLNAFAAEVTRVAREVGTEGKLGGQARVVGVAGVWKDLTENVNSMAANLTGQVRNIAEVTTAVARGDLSKKVTVDVKGEILELKSTVNTMVDQLNAFAAEVTRVAREVGTDGKLGGQAHVSGVGGVWKDLTDNVNSMAANLTAQVRGIANVVSAVANGNLERKLTLEAKGEIAALAETINGMIDTLALFADQVTNVAREVGTEGKLGGQARVPGAAGTWRDLTDNVNRLAANLTSQVRAIAEVATAVTKGDLSRSITVEASGEVASLKDNINEMIRNLKDTTRKNTEQDWLKTHLARFTRMLQGHRDLVTVSRLILSELTPLVNAQQAAFYVADYRSGESQLELLAGYAQRHGKGLPRKIGFGEGLVGQCAFEKKRIVLEAPPDYVRIGSALGSGAPVNIIILPVLFEGQVKAVIEIASFQQFSPTHQSFLDQLTESIGVVLHTISANMQTEYLLHQSQSLTAELQAQQEELKKTNDRLETQALNLTKSETMLKGKQDELRAANEQLQEKARQLSDQMRQVEFKNREIEQARAALEEKAEQLSLSSRYKSEFLANMSHELRTPLNSLLILARLLADNLGGNLTPKQVEFARTIHSSGAELLALINDILDLAKIESGTVTLNVAPEPFEDIRDSVERTFRQVASDKGLEFAVQIDPALPRDVETDAKRLQQIVTNLLSNAFKFTARGRVDLQIGAAASGWTAGHAVLSRAAGVVAFSVRDTGIGIPANKQRLIFEAFQQADGTTSREYGGTGLGLSISRELARLLGGEIQLESTPGQGSVFTLYVPLRYQPHEASPGREVNTAPALAASLHAAPAARVFEPTPEVAPAVDSGDAAEIAPHAAAALAGRKVLVVDDDIRNVFALTSALEAHGMQVMHAESGKEGIDILKRANGEIDAVLMDVMMPGLDGIDTIRIIRQLEGYRDLPIVAVTAKAMLGDREKCIDAGASDYVAKPVNVDVLLATLWRCLQPQGTAA